jgi:hypothetical protein
MKEIEIRASPHLKGNQVFCGCEAYAHIKKILSAEMPILLPMKKKKLSKKKEKVKE